MHAYSIIPSTQVFCSAGTAEAHAAPLVCCSLPKGEKALKRKLRLGAQFPRAGGSIEFGVKAKAGAEDSRKRRRAVAKQNKTLQNPKL